MILFKDIDVQGSSYILLRMFWEEGCVKDEGMIGVIQLANDYIRRKSSLATPFSMTKPLWTLWL